MFELKYRLTNFVSSFLSRHYDTLYALDPPLSSNQLPQLKFATHNLRRIIQIRILFATECIYALVALQKVLCERELS